MPLIPEQLIDEIQARADIAEWIGRYVPLKKSGRHFKANCPFHKERTPSFMVNTEKQIFHCFGCGVGGNIFSFLMQHDRLTFPEAVRQVADHVGIRMEAYQGTSSDGAHQALAALMEKVCGYFERLLLEPKEGAPARGYLRKRGVSEATCRRFRLGLAPSGWDRLFKSATANGVSSAQLEAAGLIIKGKSGYYDRFRQRLMFPIVSSQNRLVGFGGRSLDSQEPKYLNSPETVLYSKGRHLFGLAHAKEAIVELRTVILVEGYFDCVVLAEAGFSHVVSPLGTALTSEQARLLKRYAETVILAFDADAAGEQATLRGIDLLIEAGLQVRVATLPVNMDPDECVRTEGRERFQERLKGSLSLFDFLIQSAQQRFSVREAEGKVRSAQFVLPTIAKVSDAMLRSEYVRLLAERLHLDEAAVAQELIKARPRSETGFPLPTKEKTDRPLVPQGPERLLTALILDEPSRWEGLKGLLRLEEITDPTLRHILSLYCEQLAAGQTPTPAQVVSRLPEEQAALVTTLVELARSTPEKDEALQDCLRRVQAQSRRRELAKLRDQLSIAQQDGRLSDVQRLLAEYQQRLSITSTATQTGDAQLQEANANGGSGKT